MANLETTSALPPEILADVQAVLEHAASGKPLDPEIARRIHERAAKITEEIRQKHGVQNIGVSLIRELRGELPES